MLCDFSLVIIILKIRAIKIFLKPFLRFCYLMCFDAKNAPVLFGITLCTKKGFEQMLETFLKPWA